MTSVCLPGRPGGIALTARAVEIGGFKPGSKILDVGCGAGTTVAYLAKTMGFQATGMDINPAFHSADPKIIHGNATHIPFPDKSLDGIVMECSFSVVDDQQKVLQECYRVMKDNGKLIITDMYARGEPVHLNSILGRLDQKDHIVALLANYQFEVKHFEDYTNELQTLWGQMIMDHGLPSFHAMVGCQPEKLKPVRCGYYLILANKLSR